MFETLQGISSSFVFWILEFCNFCFSFPIGKQYGIQIQEPN